jgi:predicted transcriptional regulator
MIVKKFAHGACPKCGTPRTVVNPEWLRAVRVGQGLSVRTMATRIGVSAPYVSDVERGHRACTAKMRAAYEALV